MTRWRWQHSHPAAVTDRLPTVAAATTSSSSTSTRSSTSGAAGQAVPTQRRPRAPRTLRLARVRRRILRDPIDQVAADQLESVLRGGGYHEAGAVLTDAVVRGRLVPDALWQHTMRAAALALCDADERLEFVERRAQDALAARSARCERCTAAELCRPHQEVLWRWWDIRDAAAVAIVNTTVAALTAGPPAPASPKARRSSRSRP